MDDRSREDRSEPPADAGLRRLVADVFATEGEEIQCNQAAQQIALAAAAVLSDEAARQRFPRLFAHFRYCPDCQQEYELLMAFARAEAAGAGAPPSRVPPVPAAYRGPKSPVVGRLLRILFPGFAALPPLTAGSALRGATPLPPVMLAFADGMTIRLDAELRTDGPGLHLLTVTPQSGGTYPLTVELLSGQEPDWQVEDSQPVGSGGEATLLDLPAGDYRLRLIAPESSYIVDHFVVP